MARLKDLVNVEANRDFITIQDVKIPVIFTMESFEFIVESYGKTYIQFEKDMNEMLKTGKVILSKENINIMRALVYSMVRTAGTECTLAELEGSIPQNQIPDVYKKCLSIFTEQQFQADDLKKLKTGKK